MNYNKRKLFFGLIVLIIAITAGFYFKAGQSLEKTEIKSEAIISYKQTLEAEENRIFNELEKIGITRSEIEQHKEALKKQVNASFEKKPTTISPKIINLVQSVCTDMNFNNAFNILPLENPCSEAASTSKALLINEKEFSQLPVDAQKWVIAHELTHMMNADSLTNPAIEKLLKQKNYHDKQNIQYILNDYDYFQENRADFYGANAGPEYAHGFENYLRFQVDHNVNMATNTGHSSLAQRQETAKKLAMSFTPQPTEEKKAIVVTCNSQQNYMQDLQEQETIIWQRIQDIGIKDEQYNALEKKYANTLDKGIRGANKAISTDTKNLIATILTDFSVDPSTITLIPYSEYSPAAASEKAILVNEYSLKKLTKSAQKFVIGHEIQHIIYKDCLKRTVLEDLLPNNKKQELKSKNHPLNELCRLQERRADICTACKNKEYAQGYKEFISAIAKNGDTPGITHPKNADRLTLANEILATYNLHQTTASTGLLTA